MKKLFGYLAAALLCLVLLGLVYGAKGYYDAVQAGAGLGARADRLIADGRGPKALGPGRAAALIAVQDPGFRSHSGFDLSTPGAGLTTISQSLSKRLAFEEFKPGIAKIRQTGYALGLERQLSKDQIFALFLETVEMGKGPDGWMTGFFKAGDMVFKRPVAELGERDFLKLVAVMIAPSRYSLTKNDDALTDRVRRIEKLLTKTCVPKSLSDVWLDGCA